jgi:hypothetical protein
MYSVIFKDIKGEPRRGPIPVTSQDKARQLIKETLNAHPDLATGEIWQEARRIATYKGQNGELIPI